MSATSITGHGQGSADGPLRTFTNMDWISKIRNLNANQIADGSINNLEFSALNGLRSNVQNQIDAIDAYVPPENVVQVGHNMEVASIADACDGITDSSETNRYIIKVGPGIYVERLIEVPDYVYVIGDHIDSVVVTPDLPAHHVFELGNRSGLADLTISGAGGGYAGVGSLDIGNFSLLHKVSVQYCDIGILHQSDEEDSYLFLEFVDFTDCDIVIKVHNIGDKLASLASEDLYFEYTESNNVNAVIVDGDNTETVIMLANCIGKSASGNAFLVTNGGNLILTSARIRDFNRAVYADADGTHPYVKMSDVDFRDNNTNIEIANSTATGSFTGHSVYNKTVINKSNEFFISNKDERRVTVAKKRWRF